MAAGSRPTKAMVVTLLVLLGLFTEVRTPRQGYSCLHVQYKGKHYLALKFERSRLTGRVTLTMKDPYHWGLEPREGRTIELSGFDVVADSNRCLCLSPFDGRCIDR